MPDGNDRNDAVNDIIKLLAQHREVFSFAEIKSLAKLFRVDERRLLSAAWDLTRDGGLTYNTRAEFRKTPPRGTRFQVGDRVFKPEGYPYPGVVRSVATYYVVEAMLAPGMLHIFAETQLEFIVDDRRE